jgi:hypothetical protein
MRFVKPAIAALGLACSGCVVSPPPVQPVAMASPPPPPQNCREFEQTITVAGKPQKGYGTSCQQPDGSWKVVSQASDAPPPPPPAPVAAYPYPYPYPAYYYPPYYGYGGVRLGFRGRF